MKNEEVVPRKKTLADLFAFPSLQISAFPLEA